MESAPDEEAEAQAIVRVLAAVLERLVGAGAHLAASQHEETKFHSLRAPAIGILEYLERIRKYASCSKECFVLALIYIDRLIRRNGLVLTPLNVHRVVVTAVLVAAKFSDDSFYDNAYYARVGGVSVAEMNALECEFLFKIDFGLRVVPEVFDKYKDELIRHSSAMGVDGIEGFTDEDPSAGATNHPPHRRQEMDVVAQVTPPQCSYSQVDLGATSIAHPPLVAESSHEDSSPASHYPIDPLQPIHPVHPIHPMQNLQPSAAEQGTWPTAADPVAVPFPTLPRPNFVPPQHARVPSSPGPAELDFAYSPNPIVDVAAHGPCGFEQHRYHFDVCA